VFKEGDVIDVTGTTKGKGYQGVMKRHKMAGDTDTHGTHEFFRHGGSIGCRLTPGRVHKGKRMTGLMGNVKNTASDLVIVKVLEEKDVVLVKGAIPGAANGLVLIKGSVKDVRKYVVPRAVKEIESKNPMKASKKGAAAKPAKK
jgi:large subunit ribosomal protein L3